MSDANSLESSFYKRRLEVLEWADPGEKLAANLLLLPAPAATCGEPRHSGEFKIFKNMNTLCEGGMGGLIIIHI